MPPERKDQYSKEKYAQIVGYLILTHDENEKDLKSLTAEFGSKKEPDYTKIDSILQKADLSPTQKNQQKIWNRKRYKISDFLEKIKEIRKILNKEFEIEEVPTNKT